MLKQINSIIEEQVQNHRKWDFWIFTLLTIFSVLNGETTIFYVLYFFWWNELIQIIVGRFFSRMNNLNHNINKTSVTNFGSLFLMIIYCIFIIVFFGIIANWKNHDLVIVNLHVLMFKNWFFNINLLFVLFQQIYLYKNQYAVFEHSEAFTGNMVVLHISIVLGGLLMFFVVKNYPTVFTPENLWGSVIIILPFFLLKAVVQYFTTSAIEIQQ